MTVTFTHTQDQRKQELTDARKWVHDVRVRLDHNAACGKTEEFKADRAELIMALNSEALAFSLFLEWPVGSVTDAIN
ncbi:hypothetical protein BH11PSE7_BH11PSE7_21980 [soil metagenome]